MKSEIQLERVETQPQVNCEGCGRFPVPHVGAVTVVRPHHVGAIWKYNLPRFLLPDWTSPLQGKDTSCEQRTTEISIRLSSHG
ncbi:hypothetical protein TNCV_3164341 [Trichonephila clavipes]|nr:hypothetical protein TNCV_3164341 [Trichonephila clavipes]